MSRQKVLSNVFGHAIVLWVLGFTLALCGISAGDVSAASDSLDQLYEKAKKEGKITIYAPLSVQTKRWFRPVS